MNKHSYFEVFGDKTSYSLIYRTKALFKSNDIIDLTKKNKLVSEGDFIGLILGSKYKASKYGLEIPKGIDKIKLIKGLSAKNDDDETSLWWKEKG